MTIGAIVCAVFAYFILLFLWMLLRAALQAFVYQLWMYKKAKVNGRELKKGLFWHTYGVAFFDLFGMRYSEDPIRQGNSLFYGWTFKARKDSVFVSPEPKLHRVADDDDAEEDIDDADESDIVATYDPKDKK